MESKIKLLVFDWDDVFTLGSHQGYNACYKEAAQGVGIELSDEEVGKRILTKWGRPHRDEIVALLKENPELVDDAVHIYEEAIMSDTFTEPLTLVEGSVEMLLELSKSYTLAIATGLNPIVMKERVFPKFNIPPVFTQIVTSYDLPNKEHGKPYPDMLLQILREQEIEPENALMIGDAPGDIRMGKAAGVKTVAVLTGLLNENTAQEVGADYIIESVIDLKDLLARI